MGRGVSVPRDERGRKWCSGCQTYREPTEFQRRSRYPDGLNYECAKCTRAELKAARERDPERFKEYERRYRAKPETAVRRRSTKRTYREMNPTVVREQERRQNLRRYKITPEEFDALAAAQDGRCAICKGEPVGKGKRLHVDHNHTTGAIRALLCARCNAMIGYAREEPATLLAAVDYLRSWSIEPRDECHRL